MDSRFEVEREIGRGSSGVVYLVRDTYSGRRLALKTTQIGLSDSPLDLKREFRTRAGIRHPNLVQMFELVQENFRGQLTTGFTMEYLNGYGLLDHVARSVDPSARATQLLSLLPGLLEGLWALHRIGLVHRDVKPSNVLVVESGRPVLVDFGFAVDRGATDSTQKAALRSFAGTPAYMAPEVFLGAAPHPSQDVFSLGATLLHCVEGVAPFKGESYAQLQQAKLRGIARLPAGRLGELLGAMLNPAPTARPQVDSMIIELTGSAPPVRRAPFVGRAAEREYIASPRLGKCTFVIGPSGVGKTALVTHALTGNPTQLVLLSRCYPAEQIAHSAIDGLVDGLVSFGQGTYPEEDLDALERVFHSPLRTLRGASRSRTYSSATADDATNQIGDAGDAWRAAQAFARCLTSLSRDQPVRIVVDDLQWADPGSFLFLRALLNTRSTHSLIATLRPPLEPACQSFVDEYVQNGSATVLHLEPLNAAEIRMFLRDAGRPHDEAAIAKCIATTNGLPSLLEHLDSALDTLSTPARSLLTLLALLRAPLDRSVLSAELLSGEAQLGRAALIRVASTGREAIELTHESIGASLLAAMSAVEIAAHALQLATLLEQERPPRYAQIGAAYLAAGEKGRAATWYEAAASEAELHHAWSTAAAHYGLAVTLCAEAPAGHSREQHAKLHRRKAQTLANAGYIKEAADAWIVANRSSPNSDALLRAAELRFAIGEVRAGLDSLLPVAQAANVRLPRNIAESAAQALFWRLRTRLRGLHFHSPANVSPEVLHKLDVLFAIGGALGMADAVAAFAIQSQHVFRALNAGDADRLTRAIGTEIVYVEALGSEAEYLRELNAALDKLTSETLAPEVRAFVALSRGYGAFLCGDLVRAHASLTDARTRYASLRISRWENEILERGALWVSLHRGEVKSLSTELADRVGWAHTGSDWLTWMQLRLLASHVHLIEDECGLADSAISEVEASSVGEKPWGTIFLIEHARLHLEVYEERWNEANVRIRRLKSDWAPVMKFLHVRAEFSWLSALVSLRTSEGMSRSVRRAVKQLHAEAGAWPQALGWTALAADRTASTDKRIEDYRRAGTLFTNAGFALHALAVELRAAELQHKISEVEDIQTRIADRGVVNVEAFVRSLAGMS